MIQKNFNFVLIDVEDFLKKMVKHKNYVDCVSSTTA